MHLAVPVGGHGQPGRGGGWRSSSFFELGGFVGLGGLGVEVLQDPHAQDLQGLGVVLGREPDQHPFGAVGVLGRHRVHRGPDHRGLVDQQVPGGERGAQRRPGGEGISASRILRCASVRVWWVVCAQWFAVDVAPDDSPTPAVLGVLGDPELELGAPARPVGSAWQVSWPSRRRTSTRARCRPGCRAGSWMAATVCDTRCRGASVTIAVMASLNQQAPTFRGPKEACPQQPKVKKCGGDHSGRAARPGAGKQPQPSTRTEANDDHAPRYFKAVRARFWAQGRTGQHRLTGG